MRETWVQSLGGKIPWRRKWQPTPVFLPGESHGRRSLVGYSPQGLKESDATERLSDFTFTIDLQRCSVLLGRGKAATHHQPGLIMEEQQ